MTIRGDAFIFALGVVLAVTTPASADHMNGRYFGTGDWADYSLDTIQRGRTVEGQLARCGERLLTYFGYSDGGDNANGEAADARTGNRGWFEMTWAATGVLFRFGLGNEQWQAQFGAQPMANRCNGGGGERRDEERAQESPGERFGGEGEGSGTSHDGQESERGQPERGEVGGDEAILPDF